MTQSPTVTWTPKQAALRDLILLMLHQRGGIVDGTGRAASRIREYYTIPDTKTNGTSISEVLGLMEQAKLIVRRMDEGRTRTYGVELTSPLTDDDIARLETSRASNVALFIGGKIEASEGNLVELVRLCQVAYRELQGAADRAPRRDASGRVAINAAGVLQAIGIGKIAAKPLRYYLKELGLICSHNQCDDTDARLWWWTISTDPLDAAKLRNLATGEKSFEKASARRSRERTGVPEAGPVTIRRIDGATSAAGDGKERDQQTVTPRPGPPPGRPVAAPSVTAQVTDEDPTTALLAIINGLEAQLADKDEAHAKVLRAKDDEIAELREQLNARPPVDPRVAEVLARYGNK